LPSAGQFALDAEYPKTPYWYCCRENFNAEFTSEIKGFFYSIHPQLFQHVSGFINKIEQILEIPFSFFEATNKSTVLWFEPNEFWRSCFMRRSLLTALLRCSLNYNGENFDDTLFSIHFNENRWIRETKAATMRFLYGFTHWTGSVPNYTTVRYGWHEEFRFLNTWELRKRLINPLSQEKSLIGVESLWA
jgi:hypothetical protein